MHICTWFAYGDQLRSMAGTLGGATAAQGIAISAILPLTLLVFGTVKLSFAQYAFVGLTAPVYACQL
jgi:hypothetical protein